MEAKLKDIESLLVQLINEEAQKEIEAEEKKQQISWETLQKAAQNFLDYVAQLDIQSKNQEKKIKLEVQQSTLKFDTDLIKEARIAREFYQALFKFDELYALYLGQPPKRALFVVTDSDGLPHTYEMSLSQLAEQSQGRGRLGHLNTSNLKSIEDQIEENLEGLKEHVQKGRSAVQGINNRLNRFYEGRGTRTNAAGEQIASQRQGGLLMWKAGGGWTIVKIPNAGVLNEAYTHFLLTKHNTEKDYLKKTKIGKSPYYSHSLIGQFYKYFSNVTTEKASLKEDVYRDWAQYAVKGAKAELPSPDQYILLAQRIVSSQSKISPQEWTKEIKADIKNKEGQLASVVAKGVKNLPDKLTELLEVRGFKNANIPIMIKFK